MKQLPFTVPTNVFVHLLFSYHITLVKMRILNSFYFLNIYSTSGGLELAQDVSIFRGNSREWNRVSYQLLAFPPSVWEESLKTKMVTTFTLRQCISKRKQRKPSLFFSTDEKLSLFRIGKVTVQKLETECGTSLENCVVLVGKHIFSFIMYRL